MQIGQRWPLQIMFRFIWTRWMHEVKIRTLAGLSGWSAGWECMSVFDFFTTQAKSGSTVGLRMSCWFGEDELRYGHFGCLVVVSDEAPIGTHAGRLGQSDRYGRMNEPRSNCSERHDLHAGRLQLTDPRTGAHHKGSKKQRGRDPKNHHILTFG